MVSWCDEPLKLIDRVVAYLVLSNNIRYIVGGQGNGVMQIKNEHVDDKGDVTAWR